MRTTLRKVGGSVMVTLPPAMLEQLDLSVGAAVTIDLVEGRMVVEPARPRYTVEDLLVGYDPELHRTKDDQEWLDLAPIGRELI